MGLKISQQQSRKELARLDLLRQELLAPVLSIEGHAELLREQIGDEDDLGEALVSGSGTTVTGRSGRSLLSAKLLLILLLILILILLLLLTLHL